MSRKISLSLAIAIAFAGLLSVAQPAMAGKKKSKPSVSSCAIGFSQALPKAVFKAQDKGTFLNIEFFSTPFKAKVLFSKKSYGNSNNHSSKNHDDDDDDDDHGHSKSRKETWYYLVECGKIQGPYKKH